MKRQEAEALADIILQELKDPTDIQKVFEKVEKQFTDASQLIEFISTKDRQFRRIFYLESEKVWFKLYGWTMAKTLMFLGIISAVLFYISKDRVDVANVFPYFIFGASAYYLFLYLLSINRYSKNKKKVINIINNYREELGSILKELIQQHHLDSEKYNISKV